MPSPWDWGLNISMVIHSTRNDRKPISLLPLLGRTIPLLQLGLICCLIYWLEQMHWSLGVYLLDLWQCLNKVCPIWKWTRAHAPNEVQTSVWAGGDTCLWLLCVCFVIISHGKVWTQACRCWSLLSSVWTAQMFLMLVSRTCMIQRLYLLLNKANVRLVTPASSS